MNNVELRALHNKMYVQIQILTLTKLMTYYKG